MSQNSLSALPKATFSEKLPAEQAAGCQTWRFQLIDKNLVKLKHGAKGKYNPCVCGAAEAFVWDRLCPIATNH